MKAHSTKSEALDVTKEVANDIFCSKVDLIKSEEDRGITDEFLRDWTEIEDKKDTVNQQCKTEEEKDAQKYSKEQQSDEKNIRGDGTTVELVSKRNNQLIAMEADQLIKTLCKDAPKSEKATGLCRFQCPKCSKVFTTWLHMTRHFAMISDCQRKVSVTNVAEFIIRVVCHVCKICSELGLCDAFFIMKHVKKKHKMSFKDYVKMFSLDTSLETSEKTISNKISEEADKLIETLCQGAPVSDKVTIMCRFKCPDCGKELLSWDNVRRHFASDNANCNRKISILNIAEMITRVVCHVCKICSKKVLCDSVFIVRHIRTKHQMLPKEYVEMFALDTSIEPYVKKNRKSKNKKIDEYLYSIVEGAPVSENPTSMCLFHCPQCKRKITCWDTLKRHFASKSVCQLKTTLTDVEKFLTKVVCHICKMCTKKILCDAIFIERHLRIEHKTSRTKYMKKFDFDNSLISPEGFPVQNIQISHDADIMIRNLCQGAPVSDRMTTMCKFKCFECKMEISSWDRVRRHYYPKSACHRKISIANVADFITKIVSHACKICSTLILCDPVFIDRHLRKEHQMLTREYVKKFALDTSMYTESAKYSNNFIGNLCTYQCDVCEEQFDGFIKFIKHKNKSLHQSTNNLMKKVYHKCKLCHKTGLCEISIVQGHLRTVHKISLEQYCQNNGCVLAETKEMTTLSSLTLSCDMKNRCIFKCNTCKKDFDSLHFLSKHKKEQKHDSNILKPIKNLVMGYSYKCNICSKLMLCDNVIIKRHMRKAHDIYTFDKQALDDKEQKEQYNILCETFSKRIPWSSKVYDTKIVPIQQVPIREVTSAIGNLCLFQCPNCDLPETPCWKTLLYHLRSAHQQGKTFSASFVARARYHSCLLCPNAVLSDRCLLENHLRVSHNMDITKYERIYERNGGNILPTFHNFVKRKAKSKRMTVNCNSQDTI